MQINGIQSYNNSTNFQSKTHFNSKEMRRTFINGENIVRMFKQEKEAFEQMPENVDLYFFAGHSPKAKASDPHNVIKIMAVDTNKRPSSATEFTYAYLIESGSLTKTAKAAIERLNNNEAVTKLTEH